jgi:adenine-specific DNA-methyltransferase
MNENKNYLSKQLITYIGNKRKLIDFIETAIIEVKKELKKDKISILDGFAGSGIVSRSFKKHAEILYSNDLEYYSYIIGQCYLSNKENVPTEEINYHINEIKNLSLDQIGIMQKYYAPKDDKNIQNSERCFFTTHNAKIIDAATNYIHNLSKNIQPFLLAPLLSEISIHANTSGVFKGFYKNSKTGIGQFGGDGKNALQRILGNVEINFPVLSNFFCKWEMYNKDINDLVKELPEIDLAYYDPPYNQHPYGSNYFMLNLIATNQEPKDLSKVSGIPADWNKSNYNNGKEVELFLNDLVLNTKAKYIALSYNNEGLISIDRINDILKTYGEVSLFEKEYNTFRGSRNLKNRNNKVKELLFLLKKNYL